jgi:NDP-sugar pyrophosphorylase family protein
MDALILAAGDGTRLQPLTEDRPKVMIDIWNVPVLERVLFSLKEAGIKPDLLL